MLTAVAPVVSVVPSIVERPRRRFRQLEQPYPLFGLRDKVVRVAMPAQSDEIRSWLCKQSLVDPKISWEELWPKCRVVPGLFKPLWTVTLYKRSRQLAPGQYVFVPMSDFLHVPGNPPPVVHSCVQQAQLELPKHEFVYLDLVWESFKNRELLSGEKLMMKVVEEEKLYCRQWQADMALIARARKRQAVMRMLADEHRPSSMQRWELDMAPVHDLATAQATMDIDIDRWERALRRGSLASLDRRQLLLASIGLFIRFETKDPVVVALEPKLLVKYGGRMPLALIVHWD